MVEHDNANAFEKHRCPKCGFEHTHKFKWDWGKFWQSKAQNVFIAWIVYMILQTIALFTPLVSNEYTGQILWISAGVTLIFMMPLAIGKAIGNAKIEVALKNK